MTSRGRRETVSLFFVSLVGRADNPIDNFFPFPLLGQTLPLSHSCKKSNAKPFCSECTSFQNQPKTLKSLANDGTKVALKEVDFFTYCPDLRTSEYQHQESFHGELFALSEGEGSNHETGWKRPLSSFDRLRMKVFSMCRRTLGQYLISLHFKGDLCLRR